MKVFKNLSVEEPRENDTSEEGVMLPATCSLSVGAATPIPTLPLARIVKSETPVELATVNGLRVDVPCTKSEAAPVEVPMLIRLLRASARKSGLEDVPTWKEPKTEELPWEVKPPTPTVKAVPTFSIPCAVMSLRTERLPASSEWMMAEVDSRPPRSRMERVLTSLFAT